RQVDHLATQDCSHFARTGLGLLGFVAARSCQAALGCRARPDWLARPQLRTGCLAADRVFARCLAAGLLAVAPDYLQIGLAVAPDRVAVPAPDAIRNRHLFRRPTDQFRLWPAASRQRA